MSGALVYGLAKTLSELLELPAIGVPNVGALVPRYLEELQIASMCFLISAPHHHNDRQALHWGDAHSE